jgi:hypothetical protein
MKWFHVNIHDTPQQSKKHVLKALVKRVVKLRRTGLEVCHCIEELTLHQIRPLGRREKLAFKCPRLANPNYNL